MERGPSPTHEVAPESGLVAATMPLTTTPDVTVEQAANDDGSDRVLLSGVAFHDGLNANAWGLTESGARTIAESLAGSDFTAGHPHIRGGRYDRPLHEAQGMTIGRVLDTAVIETDEAMLDGGGYTAEYTAEILDEPFKRRYASGLLTDTEYGVSIGIYADPEDATCSACREPMAECDHDRFEEVEVEQDTDSGTDTDTTTTIAGPLYESGESDHLAGVYFPAYDDATVSVSSDRDEAAAPSGDGATPTPNVAALSASYDAPEPGERDNPHPTGAGTSVHVRTPPADAMRVTIGEYTPVRLASRAPPNSEPE